MAFSAPDVERYVDLIFSAGLPCIVVSDLKFMSTNLYMGFVSLFMCYEHIIHPGILIYS